MRFELNSIKGEIRRLTSKVGENKGMINYFSNIHQSNYTMQKINNLNSQNFKLLSEINKLKLEQKLYNEEQMIKRKLLLNNI